MSVTNEEEKIRRDYAIRDASQPWNDWKRNIYHPRHSIGNLLHEHNHNILCDALNAIDLNLGNLKVLDVGCGYGYWLHYLVGLGATPENLVGIDISEQRIEVARRMNPAIDWRLASTMSLPFCNGYFDFVMQSVVFSSIQDVQTRVLCAQHMHRLTKTGGTIFWLDLMRSASRSLSVFKKSQVLEYFPNVELIYERCVHPSYFRKLTGARAWLAKSIYHFTDWGCESQLLMLRKSADE